jgi:hypothetical protein
MTPAPPVDASIGRLGYQPGQLAADRRTLREPLIRAE